MKPKNRIYIVIMAILLIIAISNYSTDARTTVIQKPFDGQVDNFKVELQTFSGGYGEGNSQHLNTLVTNIGTKAGTMYVECGILDQSTNTWLNEHLVTPKEDADFDTPTTNFPIVKNCDPSQKYIATKKVTLKSNEKVMVGFDLKNPLYSEMKKPIWYCSAYEQCAQPGVDAHVSSTFANENFQLMEYPRPIANVNTTKAECDAMKGVLLQTTACVERYESRNQCTEWGTVLRCDTTKGYSPAPNTPPEPKNSLPINMQGCEKVVMEDSCGDYHCTYMVKAPICHLNNGATKCDQWHCITLNLIEGYDVNKKRVFCWSLFGGCN